MQYISNHFLNETHTFKYTSDVHWSSLDAWLSEHHETTHSLHQIPSALPWDRGGWHLEAILKATQRSLHNRDEGCQATLLADSLTCASSAQPVAVWMYVVTHALFGALMLSHAGYSPRLSFSLTLTLTHSHSRGAACMCVCEYNNQHIMTTTQ